MTRAAERLVTPSEPHRRGAILWQALRRLLLLFLAVAAGSAIVALPVGTLLGASVDRSVTLAWYGVGAFALIGGFFVGNRGPVRSTGGGGVPLGLRGRRARWATPEEQRESVNLSAVLIVLGFALIVLAVVADTRFRLY